MPGSSSFPAVLSEELQDVDRRRAHVLHEAPPTITGVGPASIESLALARNLAGMGISGGGIRSATFNLGILQGLSEHGLLPYLDYLSTVSGGGYIGSWLHGVIQRMHGGEPAAAATRLSPESNPVPGPAAEDPISFLRKYSNYLAPRLALFSADVWVIVAIWIRNIFLNQCVLVPFFAAVLLAPVLLGLYHQAVFDEWRDLMVVASFIAAGALLAFATLNMTVRLRQIVRRAFSLPRRLVSETLENHAVDAGGCASVIFAAAVLMGAHRTNPIEWPWLNQMVSLAVLAALFLIFQVAGGFVECFSGTHEHKGLVLLHLIWMPAVCTTATAALFAATLAWIDTWRTADPGNGDPGAWHAIAWGPPLMIGVLCVGVSLLLGFMGSDYPDAAREWISRLGAVLAIYSAAWMAAFALGVYAPLWIALLFATSSKIGVGALAAWAVTSGGGVLAGNSGKTSGANGIGSIKLLELIGKIAPAVFMAGYLAFLSMALHWGIRRFAEVDDAGATARAQQVNVKVESDNAGGLSVGVDHPAPGTPGDFHLSVPSQGNHHIQVDARATSAPAWTQTIVASHWQALDGAGLVFSFTNEIAGAAGALLIVSFIFAGRININEFSMHHFYKNRLARCYLGASRGRSRQPNSWTGFDPKDDVQLQDLQAARQYYGPYPVVNTALNTNRGSELAKQERKAASFVYTPLYCGFTPEDSEEDARQTAQTDELHAGGYRATAEFSSPGGPHIGTAMAISGAAASPNMGYHTSGGLSFLLTVFNVRLGWWVGNPRWDSAARRPGPVFALRYLLDEAAAQTTERSRFLNLSDGGHFENLGLYELVRRRCRFIVLGDGEQDPGLTFGSLAGAIRKCRTDFGVEIDIDLNAIRETDGYSQAHCAVGTITYPEQDPNTSSSFALRDDAGRAIGLLVYLKASLTGDEPEDVREYRSRFAEFPHQSTGDQFFTESQFESYRQLGLHVIRTALHDVPRASIADCANALARKWYPSPEASSDVTSELADAYASLLDKLKSDPRLGYLDCEIVAGLPPQPVPTDPEVLRAGFLFLLDVIRLAENVFAGLNFASPKQRENLSNAGWLTIFRYWSQQPQFHRVWSEVRSTLNPRFREFFEAL